MCLFPSSIGFFSAGSSLLLAVTKTSLSKDERLLFVVNVQVRSDRGRYHKTANKLKRTTWSGDVLYSRAFGSAHAVGKSACCRTVFETF